MSERIVLTHQGHLNPTLIENGRRMLPAGFDLVALPQDTTRDELAQAIVQADYLLGFIPWLADEAFANAKRLKLVQLMSAGYDQLNIPGLIKAGVPVSSNGGANAVAVAEHTVLLMLAVYRQLIVAHRSVREGRWEKGVDSRSLLELERKTVGLVGFGAIGREVARRLRSFNVRMVYTDVTRLPEVAERDFDIAYLPLDELLQRSDVVSLHVPLNDGTRNMIDARALSLMKPASVLINTSRGEVIDEAALSEALRRGHLLGAGLDTVVKEPARPDNPLFEFQNVIVTPHIGGPTFDSFEKRFINAYANIERVSRGERPLWIIPEMR